MPAEEIDPPLHGIVIRFDDTDRVGRIATDAGEEIRFGASSCSGFAPTPGLDVFVTVIDAHPLGGRRALKVRAASTPEHSLRAQEQQRAAAAAAEAVKQLELRRQACAQEVTPEAVARRVRDSLTFVAHDWEPDKRKLHALVEDLELAGRTVSQARAVIDAIAAGPLDGHYGSPGPLVHFVESIDGFEIPLLDVARRVPTMHFVWMLGRIINSQTAFSADARAILEQYADGTNVAARIREFAREIIGDVRA